LTLESLNGRRKGGLARIATDLMIEMMKHSIRIERVGDASDYLAGQALCVDGGYTAERMDW